MEWTKPWHRSAAAARRFARTHLDQDELVRGVEFKRGAAAGANLTIDGLQCLRDECPLE